MSKIVDFLKKCNPLNLWTPVIAAYKRDRTGQQVTPKQRAYLKWGSISLIFLFSLAWFIFYLPHFIHQGNASLFIYTGTFVQPFFDGVTSPRVSEFIWRWIAQFYTNVPLICLVVLLLVVGFCWTSHKTAGPYTPFLLPLFFLLFPSPNPEQAGIAIGLWLVMVALAVYSDLARSAARSAGGIFPLVLMHLFGALASAFLYYGTGHWALIFGIATTLFHLIGVVLSLGDKKEGLLKIRFINFIITVVVMLATGIFFWNHSSYSPFHAKWYVWVSLMVFGLACIPGLVLQAYNNRKEYIYRWKKRQGENPDGKPVLASSYNVLLSFLAICLGFVLFLFSQDREYRTMMRVENAIENHNYEKSLGLCRDYLYLNEDAPQKHRKRDAVIYANILADYKLALLMEGELNRGEWLSLEADSARGIYTPQRIYSLPLVNEMFPQAQTLLGEKNYTYLAVCRAMKMAAPALTLVLNTAQNEAGLQGRHITSLLGASLELQQYNLFRHALHLANRTLNKKNMAYYYFGLSKNLLVSYEPDSVSSFKADNPDVLVKEGWVDDWVKETFEKQVFGGRLVYNGNRIYIDHISAQGKQIRRQLTPGQDLQKPGNTALLEYYTFLTLKENNLALKPYLQRLYKLAGFEELPNALK